MYLVYLDPMFGSFLEILLWREPIWGEFFLQDPEFLNWQLISYIEPVSCGLFVLQLFSEYFLLVAIILKIKSLHIKYLIFLLFLKIGIASKTGYTPTWHPPFD